MAELPDMIEDLALILVVAGDIGVMFLLFSLGLDFSFKKILKMGASPVISTCTTIFCMSMLGFSVGSFFGWERMDCIFLGGMLAMSSTTIIYKAFDDLGLRQQQFAGLVMSVLILEDILAIVMMVMLSAIAQGNLEGSQMIESVMRIGFFLILWLIVGIFAIPLFLRTVRSLINAEVLLVVSLGLCCAMAVFSSKVGFSSAFGAFIMGSILAETVEAERIEKLVEPVKNLFGAIFFVSVGMLVDPKILVEYAIPIMLKSAMRCGFSMAQIGEFSFIIASLGLSLGVISDFLYPVVVAVSVITTFLTPYMIRLATPVYNNLEHRLPNKLINSLNSLSMNSHQHTHGQNYWKKLLTQMTVNTVVYSILTSAAIAVMFTFVLPFVRSLMPGWELHWYANGVTGVLTVLVIAPFLRAMVMKKNRSPEFRALWAESNRNRLPLLFTILVRAIIAISFIFYICNYLSRFTNALMITIGVIVILLIIFSRWVKHRSITLERLFVQNLRSRDIAAQVYGKKRPLYADRLLDRDIHIADFEVPLDSKWMGQSLKQLNLGKKYGVHISSILRSGWRINIPDGDNVIFPGDILQAIGDDEQFSAFREALDRERLGVDPDSEKRLMKLRQLVISGGSPFVGKTLIESGIRDHYSCMVIGLEEGKQNLSAFPPNRKFKEGDIIWVVGEEESLDTLIKE